MIKYSINLAEFFCISEGTPGVMGDQGGGSDFSCSLQLSALKNPPNSENRNGKIERARDGGGRQERERERKKERENMD